MIRVVETYRASTKITTILQRIYRNVKPIVEAWFKTISLNGRPDLFKDINTSTAGKEIMMTVQPRIKLLCVWEDLISSCHGSLKLRINSATMPNRTAHSRRTSP
jgi:hypothetical protein